MLVVSERLYACKVYEIWYIVHYTLDFVHIASMSPLVHMSKVNKNWFCAMTIIWFSKGECIARVLVISKYI